MDIEVAHQPSGGSEAGPSSPADRVIVVMALPGELGTGRPVARAVAHIEKALERSEDDLAARRSREGEVRLLDEVEDIVVPGVHLDDAPAPGKRLGKGGHLRHHAPPPKRRGSRTKL